jgi:hypothetical protein
MSAISTYIEDFTAFAVNDPWRNRQRGARYEPGQLTLHAARGSSMTSKPVAFLPTDLGIATHPERFPAGRPRHRADAAAVRINPLKRPIPSEELRH